MKIAPFRGILIFEFNPYLRAKTMNWIRVILFLLVTAGAVASEWTVEDGENKELSGRKVDVKLDGTLVARLIYGEGQIKPYLTVMGESGDELNHWDPKQTFPHHRGIFIGWNQISSDLPGPVDKKTGKPAAKGTYDLWHFNNGGKMEIAKLEKLEGGKDSATIVASIIWHGGAKDESGNDVLLNETRTLKISRPAPKKTQVDARFELKAARDLTLGGDLQHAGIHFRSTAELCDRQTETAYVWEPNAPNNGGKAVSNEFKYARLVFPVRTHPIPYEDGKKATPEQNESRWYTATHLNAPTNPVEELSTREYGRFGYFFKKALKKDETLSLQYRIITELAETLKDKPIPPEKKAAPAAADAKPKPGATGRAKLSADEDARQRAEAQAEYDAFVKDLKK